MEAKGTEKADTQAVTGTAAKPDRPGLLMHKTYADATTAPEPGTAAMHGASGAGGTGRTSKLPPGGSWEIVEEAELKEEAPVDIAPPGKEAVRQDVEDILRGELARNPVNIADRRSLLMRRSIAASAITLNIHPLHAHHFPTFESQFDIPVPRPINPHVRLTTHFLISIHPA
jgi:hypothetical protein